VGETLEPDIEAQRDALADRLFSSANATFDLATVYLGDRLGLFRALADGSPSTSAELAGRTGLDERYVREWLEQQAVTGVLEADGSEHAASRRYTLPAGHREVLVDELSLAHPSFRFYRLDPGTDR
jgi:predicted transcriptional regulator